MEALLHDIARYIALGVEAIAILIIVIGSIEAVVNIVRLLAASQPTSMQKRTVWLEFAGWLVAALTFQLAADIVTTSFSPTWDEVGRLAAVAAIRTFLSYFLDHEVENTRRLQHAERAAESPKGTPAA
jgi:uncharacterized membrane protein